MKAYMVVVEENGCVESSFVETNTAEEMLKRVFISVRLGLFGQDEVKDVAERVEAFWSKHKLNGLSVDDAIDRLIQIVEDDEDEDIFEFIEPTVVTDDVEEFLNTLRRILTGEDDEITEVAEQTFLMAMVSR